MYSVNLSNSSFELPEDYKFFWVGPGDQMPNLIRRTMLSLIIQDSVVLSIVWKGYNVNDMFLWCKENCVDSFSVHEYNIWHFKEPTDVINFAMKWK